jgi:hypothetical protein
MPKFWSRLTPLLLDLEPLGAGIAGALLLLALLLFTG